jgi:type II secretory pathway pseudopilin PulG
MMKIPILQKNKKNGGFFFKRGFTLIETIIYIAIIILVLSSLTSFSSNISGNREKIYVLETVHDNARVIMEEVNKKNRFANDVSNPISGATSTTLAVVAPTGNITFSLVNGSLKMKEGSSATSTVNSRKTTVSNLMFTNLSAPGRRDSIKMEFDIAYFITDGGVTYTYSQHLQTVANILK